MKITNRKLVVCLLFPMAAFGSSFPDVSGFYQTNSFPVPSYPALVEMGESVNLGDFGFTNMTAGSSSFVFEESSDCLVRSIGSGDTFRIQARMGDSFSAATSFMISRFSMMSSTHPLPGLDSSVAAIGDIAYTGWKTNIVSSLFFVRNNVFVRIRSDNQNLSALPLAQHIDDALLFFSTNNMADPGGGGTIFP